MGEKPHQKKRTTSLKIVSVFLAVLLWFYVMNQGQLSGATNIISTRLEYRNVAEGLTIEGPENISVKLWGAFQPAEEVKAYVDLNGLGEGTYQLPVNVDPVRGAMFSTPQPRTVQVEVKKLKEHIVSVRYEIIHNPPTGYQVLDVVTVPDRCVVKGEHEAVSRVSSVISPINLANVTDLTTFSSRLIPRDVNGNVVTGVRIVPEIVKSYAVVIPDQTSQRVPVKAIFSGTLENGYEMGEVVVNPNMLAVLGTPQQVKKIVELSTKTIDLNGKKSSFTEVVDVAVPGDIKVYPAQVTVSVQIIESPTKPVKEEEE